MLGEPGLAGATPVVFLDTVDSTNAEAMRRARTGERGPLWIVAGSRPPGAGGAAGHGCRRRAIFMRRLLLTDPAPAAAAPQLGFVAGLAVHDAAAAPRRRSPPAWRSNGRTTCCAVAPRSPAS